jgi:hypothetical protein
MRLIVLSLVAVLILVACGTASATKVLPEKNDSDKTLAANKANWFDPNELEEHDIVIKKDDNTSVHTDQNSQKGSDVNAGGHSGKIVQTPFIQGFRIQINASKSALQMQKAKEEARVIFNKLGLEVYLVYEAPLYKLRVGDSIHRKSAEKTRNVAIENGYRDAWIVPDTINRDLDIYKEEN